MSEFRKLHKSTKSSACILSNEIVIIQNSLVMHDINNGIQDNYWTQQKDFDTNATFQGEERNKGKDQVNDIIKRAKELIGSNVIFIILGNKVDDIVNHDRECQIAVKLYMESQKQIYMIV